MLDKNLKSKEQPKKEKLENAPGWNSERLESFARDLHKWLVKHHLWVDVCIYYDGKRMNTNRREGERTVYRYNGEPFIEEADPRDYFDYVADPHILSMSFEGSLYELINYGFGGLKNEFQKIFQKYGVYYELGNAWNLTCYEE